VTVNKHAVTADNIHIANFYIHVENMHFVAYVLVVLLRTNLSNPN